MVPETYLTHGFIIELCLNPCSENSWELTGHGWHSLGDMVDLWVHASNLLKSSKNSWELTGHGWHSPSDIGN